MVWPSGTAVRLRGGLSVARGSLGPVRGRKPTLVLGHALGHTKET